VNHRCACENIKCEAGHDVDVVCSFQGVVPVDYVGRLCFGCIEYMPTRYIAPSSYRVERMRYERRSNR
jgi:hypothetical protein